MRSGLRAAFLPAILLHAVGLTALAVVGGPLWTPEPPPTLITTELLVPPPPPPAEPVPPPELAPISPPRLTTRVESIPVAPPPALLPPPVTPPKVEKITPPRLVAKTPPKLQKAPTPKVKPPAPPQRQPLQPAPPRAAREPGEQEKPRPGPPIPLPVENRPATGGNVLGQPTETPTNTPLPPAEGAEAGAGKLFEHGDVGVVPGAGAGGGGGGSGRAGLGTGGPGGEKSVAGLQPGAGGAGAGGGVSALARPLGGYQVKPRYPESARRQGIEGTTLLKVYISDKGYVENVLVERSAGHQELDVAAMEAVKKWRFEPARRGKQPVAIWVMLPVRFELR